EAEASGVLLRIAVTEGEVEVGKTIGFIGDKGEAVSAPADEARPKAEEKPKEAPKPVAEPAPATDGSTNGRIKASPLARRIARERGIELSQIRGTGPDGRIVAEDVERSADQPGPAAAPAGEVESRPLSNVRKTIARRLTQAWT